MKKLFHFLLPTAWSGFCASPGANCHPALAALAQDCLLPTAHCPLPSRSRCARPGLPTAHCQLPTANCLLPTAYCQLPTPPALRLAILLAAAALLLGSGCRKEDDDCFDEGNPRCSNYDPCWGKQQVSAAFEMAERVTTNFDSVWYIPTDTMLVGNQLRLRPLQPADSLRWHFSSDPRVWVDQELLIRINFTAELEVTLILWRQPDTLCFPDDTGVDTVRRRLVVVQEWEAAVIGRYYGATDARPNEHYEVEIYWVESNHLATHAHLRITGVHPGCNNTLTYNAVSRIGPGYLAYAFFENSAETTTGCMAPQGIAWLSADHREITVRFRMRNPDKITEFLPETTFRGVRL